jgi:hypothetical protein
VIKISTQIIPLTPDPYQKMQTVVNIDNQNLTLNVTLNYNEIAGYWVLGIADSAGNVLLSSIPVVTGKVPSGNLLEQYSYLNIGSWIVVKTSSISMDYPDDKNLGTDFVLIVSDTL